MSVRQSGGRPEPISAETLEEIIALARQLAMQMAEANFRSITTRPGWTMAHIEAETDRAIERMEITSRDMLTGKGADPGSEDWQMIWSAMEAAYRETMAGLLKASGHRGGEPLH